MIGTRTLEADFLKEIRKATFNTMTMPLVIYIISVFAFTPGPFYRFVAAISIIKLLC
jgi:hypothetical protein